MKNFTILATLIGLCATAYAEKYMVIDAKDAVIIKKVADVDSIYFIDADPAPDSVCDASKLAMGYFPLKYTCCPWGGFGTPCSSSWMCVSPTFLDSILNGLEGGFVDFAERRYDCGAICLSKGTAIATPDGEKSVESVTIGDTVWTQSSDGTRIAQPVVRVSCTSVPANHRMVHVLLADGRELRASPGHPLSDGRTMADLKAGDSYDGAIIRSAALEKYQHPKTYDILPAGPTGTYWANGVVLGSTLHNNNGFAAR